MTSRLHRLLVVVAATFAAAVLLPLPAVRGQMPVRAPRYAITNAKIVTAAGPTIEKGTVVMRNGDIEDVGATISAPADALIVDAAGLTVYPGLIDLSSSAVLDASPANASGTATAAPAGRGAAAAGRGGATEPITWADQERANRQALLHPDVNAALSVQDDGDGLRRLAAAGITSVLAVPMQGLIRGQSALVNVTAPPDPSEISALATYRRGVVVVRSGVAQHVAFTAGRGGGAFPGALLGVIAFIRQAFLDAQWQKDARAFVDRHKDATVGGFEPVLDALAPALDRKMPVAFEASEEREILRALGLAKEFNLDPIIVGGLEASSVIDDLKAAKAKVIVSVNFQSAGGEGGRRGGGGGAVGANAGADTAVRIIRMRQNAPKVPAALDKAGIPFGFTLGGLQNPSDLARGVGRAMREGGLSEEAALKALTVNAARLAGASERLGTIEKGRMANLIVADGNLFDGPRIRYVFVAGWPVDLDSAAPAPAGRGGRGGN